MKQCTILSKQMRACVRCETDKQYVREAASIKNQHNQLLTAIVTHPLLYSTTIRTNQSNLLSLVRTGSLDVANDLLSILSNLVPVLSSNSVGVEERSNETNTGGTHLQVITSIVEVDSTGGVDAQEGKSRADGLDPHGTSRNTGEELLQGSTVTVGHGELSGGLTSRNYNNVALSTELNDIGKHDRGDDEFGSSIHGSLGIINVHDSTTSDEDLAIIFGTEVGQVVEAVWGGEGEFSNFETSVDGGLHCLGTGLTGGGTEHGTGTVLGKPVQHLFLGLHCGHVVVLGGGEDGAEAHILGSFGCEAGGCESKGHGCCFFIQGLISVQIQL
mmetsp:Transcript_16255/g.23937  ORF Transcript_16255/g.23937 Transcript_16255/m.23937 type:complete len:329 (-) Transcript_16255:114-1100(-)